MSKEEAQLALTNLCIEQKGKYVIQFKKGVNRDDYEMLNNYITSQPNTPTSDEVCEALSEYFIDRYIYNDDKFYNSGGNEVEPVIYNTSYGVVIKYGLPPHIIKLIGEFYIGVMNDETK